MSAQLRVLVVDQLPGDRHRRMDSNIQHMETTPASCFQNALARIQLTDEHERELRVLVEARARLRPSRR